MEEIPFPTLVSSANDERNDDRFKSTQKQPTDEPDIHGLPLGAVWMVPFLGVALFDDDAYDQAQNDPGECGHRKPVGLQACLGVFFFKLHLSL